MPENKELIKKILFYHLVRDEFYAEDVVYSQKLKTFTFQYAFISTDNGPQIGNEKFGFANIIGTDIMASNGVVHVLEDVILPPDLKL